MSALENGSFQRTTIADHGAVRVVLGSAESESELAPSTPRMGTSRINRCNCTFHCFQSYRWGAFDKRLVKSLHAHLTCGVVRGVGMRVFLDDTNFQAGDHFRQAFVESILATEVFVPLVTANALDRLTRHDPQELDNLLIEWLTALLLLKFPDLDRNGSRCPLRSIIPICVEDRSQTSYFTMVSSLSRVVSVKSILELKDMLARKGICLSETVDRFLERVTV
jgi:hypothetical protein